MHESYFLYYIFSTFPEHSELFIDKDFLTEEKVWLNNLPEYEPSDKVLNKIFSEL